MWLLSRASPGGQLLDEVAEDHRAELVDGLELPPEASFLRLRLPRGSLIAASRRWHGSLGGNSRPHATDEIAIELGIEGDRLA